MKCAIENTHRERKIMKALEKIPFQFTANLEVPDPLQLQADIICGCIPSFDIGTYNSCKHGCVYCYANNSQHAVAKNFNRLSMNGESLLLPVQ